MTYLPADVPLPDPQPWEEMFWEHCRRHELRFQACADCGTVRHPPMPYCAACRSPREIWCAAPDDAELYTYTIVHHPNHPALQGAVPYNAAVVIFPSLQSVRLVTNIVGCANADFRIGMKLVPVFEEPMPGRVLPRFAPRMAQTQ